MRIGLTEVLCVVGVAGGLWFFKLSEPVLQPGREFLSWESNKAVLDNINRLGEFSHKRWQEINGGGLPYCDEVGASNGAQPKNHSTAPPPHILDPSVPPEAKEFKLMQGRQRGRTVNVSRVNEVQAPTPTPTPSATPDADKAKINADCRPRPTGEATQPTKPVKPSNPTAPLFANPYKGSGARPVPPVNEEWRDDAKINRFAYPEDKPYTEGKELQPGTDQHWMGKGCKPLSIRYGARLTYQEYEQQLSARRNGVFPSPLGTPSHPAVFCQSPDLRYLKYIPNWTDGTYNDLNIVALWVDTQGTVDKIDKQLLQRSR